MRTIQARVNTRLLSKASRLFTGTLEGRVIEILQNARRAGATEVHITNTDGIVTVQDNGRGIEDFSKLLDLGGSGWDDTFEASEDPAGVGIFCLAPREVTVRSNGWTATIREDGWTGARVEVKSESAPVTGTILEFRDEAWNSTVVDRNAVFCGLKVTVDGHACPRLPFTSSEAVHHPELGCQIEICKTQDLLPWHHSSKGHRFYHSNVLVDFHGQVVGLDYHPVSVQGLQFLVDMTGEPTGIRLMLPARTRLVENTAFEALKDALELEAYRFVQKQDEHSLPYKEYVRARELGITLPEAKPTFSVGALSVGDPPEPVEVSMPKDFPLAKSYRFDPDQPHGHDSDEANVHLLAALGKFETSFVPVEIRKCYDGYSWAKLPVVTRVEVSVGKELHQEWLWGGTLTCVDSIAVKAHTSHGQVFSSPVCLAVAPEPPRQAASWATDHVLVTPEAQERLCASEVWYHLGGWSDEGDTYDTQQSQFEEELDGFWMRLMGPDEQRRKQIVGALEGIQPAWDAVHISPDGKVRILFADGSDKILTPPTATLSNAAE